MTRTILIVDDQSDARQLIRMVMEIENCTILEASNGQRGLSMAEEYKPDCLIVDLRMPGRMDGISLCQAIKADPELSRIPVIILTAFYSAEMEQHSRIAGAAAFLEKPCNFFHLIQEVERVTLQI
jgi:CheY-like chemotaxis protein